MAFLIEPTHISILPHSRVLQVTGKLDPFFVLDERVTGTGTEYVRTLDDDETPTTVYDGLME